MTDLGYYDQSYPPSLWAGDGDGGDDGGTVTVVVLPASMTATVTVDAGTPNAVYSYDWGDESAEADITLDGDGDGQVAHTYETAGTYRAVAFDDDRVILAETDITVPGPDEPAELELEAEATPATTPVQDPAAFTIADIQAYVGDDQAVADAVLEAERARGDAARSTLVAWLEQVAGP